MIYVAFVVLTVSEGVCLLMVCVMYCYKSVIICLLLCIYFLYKRSIFEPVTLENILKQICFINDSGYR